MPRLRRGASQRGASAVEYALLAVILALAIVGSIQFLGGQLSTAFTNVGNVVGGAGH